MTRPEYLVCFLPYSRTVNGIHRVTGDTEKYWKCLRNSSGETFLVRKSNLLERGINISYTPWTKEQVMSYRKHKKVLNAVKSINFSLLSTEQLEEIIKIAEGDKNEIQNTD